MDYQWLRDFTLKLLDQYSVAGEKIADTYNNQADYLKRIPEFADDGQMYLATTTAKMRTIVALESLPKSRVGTWDHYKLPEDCWQMCSGGLVRYDGPVLHRYHRYHLIGNNSVALPEDIDGSMYLEYYRYPLLLGADPADKTPLDNTMEAQMALPYYVAAHLVMHDNAFAYSALMNEFETKLARLREEIHTELTVVEDVYSAAEQEYNA